MEERGNAKAFPHTHILIEQRLPCKYNKSLREIEYGERKEVGAVEDRGKGVAVDMGSREGFDDACLEISLGPGPAGLDISKWSPGPSGTTTL